ncbi:hypothetical protein [Sorangium sp. So ce1151]|uniref:hypothetical protein n=1 Tax=Sorangium sp. So ce1151 TaxID=3133332 RepID=UPI003F63207D
MSRVERLGTEKVGKLLLEMSSHTTLSLLVHATYSVTGIYFLSVGINSLAAAGASIISPVLIALGAVATTVGAGGASVVYGSLVCGICLMMPAALIALLSRESAIIAEGKTALRLLALSYPLTGVAMVTAASFQSVGRAREALLFTLGGLLLVKLPVLLLASRLFSLIGIWAAEASSELILCIASSIMLKKMPRWSWAWREKRT